MKKKLMRRIKRAGALDLILVVLFLLAASMIAFIDVFNHFFNWPMALLSVIAFICAAGATLEDADKRSS